VVAHSGTEGDLNVIVTAGPTREYLDPVRFLSNPSTGKMGFAIATEAVRRGHNVTLISGPVALKTPKGVKRIDVVSAREMLKASLMSVEGTKHAVFVSTAAVADWRPKKCAMKKLKKHQMSGTLKLVRNPDILKTIRGCQKIGFAAETDHILAEASRKCREKGLSFIVANDVTEKGAGFGTDTNRVTFVFPDGTFKRHPLMSKRRVAGAIIRAIEGLVK